MFATLFLLYTLQNGLQEEEHHQVLEEDQFHQFKEWKSQMNKYFATQDEEDYRFRVFEANNNIIKAHNALKDKTYTMALNQFSDLTQEEFKSIYLVNLGQYIFEEKATEKDKEPKRDFILHKHHNKDKMKQNQMKEGEYLELKSLPISYDSINLLGSIRSQGQCGSCWAFSTISTIEAGYTIRTGQLLDLSEQYLVNCGKRDYNNMILDGCEGGWMPSAFDFLRKYGGAVEEYLYPYTYMYGECRSNVPKIVRVGGYVSIANDEVSIKNAIKRYGSIATAVDSDRWAFYRTGIFQPVQIGDINHAVNVVGWGVENGQKYYLIRNSWGTYWGENGYIRLAAERGGMTQYLYAVQLD